MKTALYVAVVLSLAFACLLVVLPVAHAAAVPTFSLAWSEYPSWSTFGVLNELKLIDGKAGEMGPIEQKWGVDIELKEAEYDPCIGMYGAGKCDAVCITNMDILNPSMSRPGACVLPTSTSFGADACIVTSGITDLKQLKGKKVRGLAQSVSEYFFARNVEIHNENYSDYNFSNMDPGAAALALQQKQDGYDAIVVWNPFVLDTLNKRKDVHVLFDSTTIPGEIIDSVVIAQTSLDKPKGKEFAYAVIDAYYELNKRLADPATRDATLIALGQKFSNLDLQSMNKVVEQTRFYSTPKDGLALFDSEQLKSTMVKVVKFCMSHRIVEGEPKIGYGTKDAAPGATLRFDRSYMAAFLAK